MNVRAKTKRRLLILLAATLVIVVGLAGIYTVRMQRLRTYYLGLREQGIAQHKAGDYENAQLNLSRYLRREEYARDADALYYFADSSSRVERPNYGHLVLAASQLKRAVELRPDRDDWRRQLLQHYVDLRFNSETVETAEAILKVAPADREALRARATAMAALRDPDALKAAKKALEADPHDLRMHLLVLELYRDPKNMTAVTDDPSNKGLSDSQAITASGTILRRASQLLSENPDDGRYYLLMSAACVLAGDLSGAEQDELLRVVKRYDSEVEKAPTAAAAVYFARLAARAEQHGVEYVELLLLQLQRLGLARDAIEVAQKAESLNQPRIREYLVRRLFESERYADVERHLADVQLKPTLARDAELIGMRAAALVRLDRAAEAGPLLESLRAQDENKVALAWAVAIDHFYIAPGSGQHLKVLAAARDALAEHDSAYLRLFLAEALIALGEREQAMETYQHATQLSPLWARPHIGLSRLKLQAGRSAEALVSARMAYRVAFSLASQISTAVVWAECLRDEEWPQQKDLRDLLVEIQRAVPGEQQTLPAYVRALLATGDREQAVQAVKAALNREPPLSENTLLRLAAVSKQAQLGLENDVYAAVEKAYGLKSDLPLARALDLLARGRRDEATAFLEQGRRDKPKDEELPWRLAWVQYLEHIGDSRAAAEWTSLANDPAYSTNLSVQRAVLDARSLQVDHDEVLAQAVERLRKLTGDAAGSWRVARAKLLLKGPDADSRNVEAIRLLEEAVAVSPADVEARVLLALALQRQGKHPDAMTQLREALGRNPESLPARLMIAAMHQSQGEFDEAQQHLNLIDVQKLDPTQRHRVAQLHYQQGNIAKAMEIMRQISPDALDVVGAAFVAELTWRIGDLQQAESLYTQLAERSDITDEQRLRVSAAHADLLAATGRMADADAILAKLASLQVGPAVRGVVLGDHYARRGERAKAVEHYRAALAAEPKDEQVWVSIITQDVRAGKFSDALAVADEAARVLPQAKRIAGFRASATLLKSVDGERRYIPLIVSMLQGTPDAGTAADAIRISAAGSASLEARRQAIVELRSLSEKSPRFIPLLILLAQEHELLGKPREAAAWAQRAAQAAPGSPEVAQVAAHALAAAGDLRHALVAAQRWRGLSAGDALDADLFIAQLNLQLSDPAATIRQLDPYTAAAEADPDTYRRVIDLRSIALIASRQVEDAHKLLRPLIDRSAAWRQVWMQRAVLMGPGMPEVSEKWLGDLAPVIHADATDEQAALAGAWYELGKVANNPKYKERAKTLLDDLVQRNPASATVVNTRGMILEADVDLAGAERDYRRALALEPKHGIAANNLAMILAEAGRLPEALGFAKTAIEVYPRSSTVYDTLATVQKKMKDYPSAATSLQMAVQLEPNNPKWRVGLAELYAESGQKDEAIRLLRELDAAFPDQGRFKKDVQQALDKLRSTLGGETAMAPRP